MLAFGVLPDKAREFTNPGCIGVSFVVETEVSAGVFDKLIFEIRILEVKDFVVP